VPAVPQTDFGGQSGQPVISSGDCIGAVVNGVCHGTPAPGAPTATCHGQMVGQRADVLNERQSSRGSASASRARSANTAAGLRSS